MKKTGPLVVLAFVLGFLLGYWPVSAQFPISTNVRSSPIQQGGILNSQTTSAADTAITTTLTGVVGMSVHVQGVSARCSAGTAQMTVKDATVIKYQTAATEIGTTTKDFNWTTALSANPGDTMTVELSTCGTGNTGVLIVQADQH